jgi:hypothetical protein
MALSAENVNVAVTGKVYVAPTTASAPTASDATLTGFTELGYVSSDGITVSHDRSTAQIRAWQNSDLVREVATEATTTYAMMLLESNEDVIETYFGASIVDGKIEVNPSATGGRKSWVIDVVDGSDVIRHYIPTGEVTAVEAQTFANGEAIGYGITITAYVSDDRVADVFYGAFEA